MLIQDDESVYQGNKKIKAIIQLQEQFDSKKTFSLKANQER